MTTDVLDDPVKINILNTIVMAPIKIVYLPSDEITKMCVKFFFVSQNIQSSVKVQYNTV